MFKTFDPIANYHPLYITARTVPSDCTDFSIDFVDATSSSFETRSSSSKDWKRRMFWKFESARLARWEQSVLSRARIATAVSHRDAGILGDKCLVVPLAVSEPKQLRERDSHHSLQLLFFGTYGYLPNDEAAIWLDSHRQRFDTIGEVEIFGARATSKVAELSTFKGRFDSLEEIVSTATILLAPISSGAGVQSKVIESAALGIRCLVTPIVAEGLAKPLPAGICVAPRDLFPEALESLVAQPYDPAAIRRWADDHYSQQSVETLWHSLLGPLSTPRGTSSDRDAGRDEPSK